MNFPAHRAGLPGDASGGQNVSKGNIVPLYPVQKEGPIDRTHGSELVEELAEYVPVRNLESLRRPVHS